MSSNDMRGPSTWTCPPVKASVSVNSVSAARAGRPVRVDVARRLALAIMRVDPVAGLTEWIEPEDG